MRSDALMCCVMEKMGGWEGYNGFVRVGLLRRFEVWTSKSTTNAFWREALFF